MNPPPLVHRSLTGRLTALAPWALLVVILLAWGRSYLPDECFIRADRGRVALLFVAPEIAEDFAPAASPQRSRAPSPTRLILDDLRTTGQVEGRYHATAGFALIAGNISDGGLGYVVVTIPFWFLAALTAAAGWLLARRRRRRTRPGHCRACGYDLRASPDRCPECGTLPAKGTA